MSTNSKMLEQALEVEAKVRGPHGPMAVSIQDTLALVKLIKDSLVLRDLDQKRIELAGKISQDLIKSWCELLTEATKLRNAAYKVAHSKDLELTESKDFLILAVNNFDIDYPPETKS